MGAHVFANLSLFLTASDIDCDFVIAHPFPKITNVISRGEGPECPEKYRIPKCIPLDYRDCYQDHTHGLFYCYLSGNFQS